MAPAIVKRKDLTLKEKVQVINYTDKIKCNQCEVAKKFGISQAQVSKLLKKKETVLREWRENTKSTQKRKRTGKDPDVENELIAWFREKRARNIPISGTLLKEKAEQIAVAKGKAEFKTTNGWFCRWKNRSNIGFQKMNGKAKDADGAAANNWTTDVLPGLLENYEVSCIYNCDETTLYYRAPPDSTLYLCGEIAAGGRVQKDRLTIMCCTNADGSHKLLPYVIGTSKNASCKNVNTLPLKYTSNKHAAMTADLFTDWLMDFDTQMAKMQRKALLFMDNCFAHRTDVKLKNVTIHYLPANTTSLTQPMSQGIISLFKRNYRKYLIRKFVSTMDDYEPSAATTTGISNKITLSSAIHMLNEAWNKVTTACIKHCFVKCKFSSVDSQETNPSDYSPTAPDDDFQRFVDIGNDLTAFVEITYDEGTEEKNSGNLNVNNADSGNTENLSGIERAPSAQEVKTACDVICRFLESKPNADFTNYHKIANQITQIICDEK